MDLAELLDGIAVVDVRGDSSVSITSVTHDSRRASPGALFCCVPGRVSDGHDHAPDAVRAGAVALLCERPLDLGVTEVQVRDARAAMGPVASAFHGRPSDHLDVIGVTGTNGKTTTTLLLGAILGAAGRPTGVIGTLSGARTTPEATDLQARLAELRDTGSVAVAMEVSSHALALDRVAGTHFRLAVFTNLSQDHLDFHPTMEDYFAAKARLFEPELTESAVVSADDPHGLLLAHAARVPTRTYSLADASDLVVGAASSTGTWRGAGARGGADRARPAGGHRVRGGRRPAGRCGRHRRQGSRDHPDHRRRDRGVRRPRGRPPGAGLAIMTRSVRLRSCP
ncbi:MAG: UDP-N-acetylmuramoyl-L-alanyl-D-glutamate--2,6-diaminopimelate ligase [Actinomycetota bacterium]|nr:UDP-N-acetylmuramoyl-L-alanyl-D-glutamate--2,6-diaminopimelate ligase [Actinomycetota bacterium]